MKHRPTFPKKDYPVSEIRRYLEPGPVVLVSSAWKENTNNLIEFHLAGLGHAQPMPEDQQQQATVAGFVPAALHGFNQPFNLAAGEVLRSLS